jgi:hypothetical protein
MDPSLPCHSIKQPLSLIDPTPSPLPPSKQPPSFPFPSHVLCSDEDDTAELLKELQKIRKERMEEQEKKVSETTLSWAG